jgi:Tfp pilus assembly protein PilV
MCPPLVRQRPRRPRTGFTLLEVLVAVVLVDVGLLALVAGCAVLVRALGDTRARTEAAHAADNRLARLGAVACGSATGGSAAAPHLNESWTVHTGPSGIRELRDSVSFVLRSGPSFIVLRTRVPC